MIAVHEFGGQNSQKKSITSGAIEDEENVEDEKKKSRGKMSMQIEDDENDNYKIMSD